ncbi:MAG: hypothetical protein R3E83_11605 [Burkholderiaceae bacterium]
MPGSSPSAAVKTGGSSRWLWRLLVVLILLAGVGGFVALQVFKPRPVVKPLVRQLPVVQTVAANILTDPLPVRGQGLVSPRTQVTVAAEIAGRIAAVHPQMVAGGRFRRGELLVELDADPVRAALAQTRADFRAAETSLKLAEQSIQRTRELIAQGFLSRQTLDERVASRDQAAASLDAPAPRCASARSISSAHASWPRSTGACCRRRSMPAIPCNPAGTGAHLR